MTGIEPATYWLQTSRSPRWATPPKFGSKYENRTHDSGITTRGFATKLTSTKMLWRPPAVIIVYQKFRQVAPTSLFITYTLHPLPDRDRSRIANAGLVGPLIAQWNFAVSEPPVLVTALLIVWVRLSSDAGTFGTLGWIWTSDFWDLQSHALGHSATSALFLFCIIS